MDETIRAFIALDLNPEIKQELSRLQALLKKGPDKIGWVKPDNIHLTLKFLGHIPLKKIAAIIPLLSVAAGKYPAPQLTLTQLGAFPAMKSARVIWVGINEPASLLSELVKNLENRLAGIGIAPEERIFEPHLTLGRVKYISDREEFSARLNQTQPEALSFSPAEIILYKSALSSAGPAYERLAAAPFILKKS